MNLPLFRYIVMAAFRDRLFLSTAVLIAVVMSLSNFFGESVVVEQDQFARAFAAYGFRLFGNVILILFVVTHIRRSFDVRDIDYLLSRPIGRMKFVLTHAMAFSFIAIVAALVLGGATVLLERQGLHSGVFMWWLSIAVEFMIMANVAMFFAFVLGSATACMAITFCFYLLSRLMGEILGILQREPEKMFEMFLAKIMAAISVFIPRLDLMGQTTWILYGMPDNITLSFIIGQCAVFMAIIIGATMIDMHKRQF